jgi:Arc/MetJ-type ribon-helix-helix transcriptional regulator
MSYPFPPDVAHLVQQVMATGNFGSEDEVLRAALNTHLEYDEVRNDIQRGIDDMENGRVTPLEEVDSAMRTKYLIPHTR